MEQFISKLDTRIRDVQAELAELQTAKRVYQSLCGASTSQTSATQQTQTATTSQQSARNQVGNVSVVLKAA